MFWWVSKAPRELPEPDIPIAMSSPPKLLLLLPSIFIFELLPPNCPETPLFVLSLAVLGGIVVTIPELRESYPLEACV